MRAAPALAQATPEQLAPWLGLAQGIEPADLRARALFALLDHASLAPAQRAPLLDAARQALDACSDPASAAPALTAGVRQLAPTDYRARSDALVAAAELSAPSERLDMLMELAIHDAGDRAQAALRDAAFIAVGGLAPELAREFADDLRGLVDKLTRWAGEIGGPKAGGDLRALLAPVARLGPAARCELLVQGLTLCAFMPRMGLLQVLAEVICLGVLDEGETARGLHEGAVQVLAWYP